VRKNGCWWNQLVKEAEHSWLRLRLQWLHQRMEGDSLGLILERRELGFDCYRESRRGDAHTCIRYVWSPAGARAAARRNGLSSTCGGRANIETGLFVSPRLPLLSRALLTFRFSGVGGIFLGHESELTVLTNDVGKIGRNTHCVCDAMLICG